MKELGFEWRYVVLNEWINKIYFPFFRQDVTNGAKTNKEKGKTVKKQPEENVINGLCNPLKWIM